MAGFITSEMPRKVVTWGLGGGGTLGHSSCDKDGSCAWPTLVEGPPGLVHADVKQVACGEVSSAAVTADGKLYTWGSNRGGRLGHEDQDSVQAIPRLVTPLKGMKVTQVSAGEQHMGCVCEDGSAWVWGKGYLGDGSTSRGSAKPCQVVLATDSCQGVRFQKIVCGYRNTGLLDESRVLWTWGDNSFGKLGIGSTQPALSPVKLELEDVQDFSLGSLFSAAVCGAGRQLFTWGYGGSGNLGLGSRRQHSRPQKVVALEGVPVASVHCTVGQINPRTQTTKTATLGIEGPHLVIVTVDGRLFTAGTCNKGQLGNMQEKVLTFDGDELEPYQVGGVCRDHPERGPSGYLTDETVVQAVASSIHTGLVTASGQIYTFGCGSDGRMGVDKFLTGLGGKKSRLKCYVSQPTAIEELGRKHWRALQIDTSRRHMIAIVEIEQ